MKALPKLMSDLAVVIALMAAPATRSRSHSNRRAAKRRRARERAGQGQRRAGRGGLGHHRRHRQATRMITLKGPKGDASSSWPATRSRTSTSSRSAMSSSPATSNRSRSRSRKSSWRTAGRSCRRRSLARNPAQQPAGAAARQVTAIVDVIAVDPAKGTIRIKGPTGNVRTLKVQNPDQFKVVKVGDHIEVTYTEALRSPWSRAKVSRPSRDAAARERLS